NGTGFDLPVLHYRALYHGVSASGYWDMGEQDSNFKYNNYLNRYHVRHLDLMDVLAAYQAKAYARLDDISKMLGFPGKMGIDGSEVLAYFNRGELKTIRD
ncbi:MAG TPA: 3'-5' exonuclease, partial [Candidatus Berkiella sp.]|nr:3'-5' exonuclease [Candidatus Berkiella sp.]